MNRLCADCKDTEASYQLSPCRNCYNTVEKRNFVSANTIKENPPYEITTRALALDLIDEERDHQDIKWGEQNHPPEKWVGILGEEFGEYCQAVNETVFNNGADQKLKGGFDNMMKELTHVAAVAVGAMESLMRKKGDSHEH